MVNIIKELLPISLTVNIFKSLQSGFVNPRELRIVNETPARYSSWCSRLVSYSYYSSVFNTLCLEALFACLPVTEHTATAVSWFILTLMIRRYLGHHGHPAILCYIIQHHSLSLLCRWYTALHATSLICAYTGPKSLHTVPQSFPNTSALTSFKSLRLIPSPQLLLKPNGASFTVLSCLTALFNTSL